MSPVHLATPRFDWRELKRWGIEESALPAGSDIEFREPGVWKKYRWQILSVVILILMQGALIVGLVYERRRRRHAEINSHKRLSELAYLNRRAAVGELSASITHELYQPLTAILSNTEAAESLLAPVAEFTELKEILGDIKRDDLRASEVIKRLRNLLVNAPFEPRELDLNAVVSEVFKLLGAQAAAQRVTLSTELAPRAPRVAADRIQLQQVILNVVMNALDAAASTTSGARSVVGHTAALHDGFAEVSIEDSGPGIPTDTIDRIFEPFFTTKESGMGMGLCIARTIVESHGGQIRADNRPGGGAVFTLSLPLAKPQVA